MANKYLIVGLGNIGPEYDHTRHNAGFEVVDALHPEGRAAFKSSRYGAIARMRLKNKELVLLKPSTFMNLSGNAVRYWMKQEGIALENLLIVVDDLALPFGNLRLKAKGSDAGHNGLKHIAATLGTQNYARLRIGIGNNFERGGQIDFVLSPFSPQEQENLPTVCQHATKAITDYCLSGIQLAMNRHNGNALTPLTKKDE